MANKSRERNSAGVFSDYGLDERQKLIMANIGFKGFKLLCYSVAFVTAVLIILYYSEITIPFQFAALIYYTVAIIGLAVFEITASKHGVLNQVHSFSSTTGGPISGLMLIAAAAIKIIYSAGKGDFTDDTALIIILCVITAILQFVRYACGKRNFKVLDEQSRETDEE